MREDVSMNTELRTEGKPMSHQGVLACFHRVSLQQTHDDHLHHEDGEPHPDTVPRAQTKRHVRVRVQLAFVFFTESAEDLKTFLLGQGTPNYSPRDGSDPPFSSF